MTQPQLIFDRTLKTKQEIKELKIIIKDALVNSQKFQEVTDEFEKIKARKKSIVADILNDLGAELDKLDSLKLDFESDDQLISDSVLSELLNGNTVQVEDSYGNKYEPVIKVKFKKVK